MPTRRNINLRSRSHSSSLSSSISSISSINSNRFNRNSNTRIHIRILNSGLHHPARTTLRRTVARTRPRSFPMPLRIRRRRRTRFPRYFPGSRPPHKYPIRSASCTCCRLHRCHNRIT